MSTWVFRSTRRKVVFRRTTSMYVSVKKALVKYRFPIQARKATLRLMKLK